MAENIAKKWFTLGFKAGNMYMALKGQVDYTLNENIEQQFKDFWKKSKRKNIERIFIMEMLNWIKEAKIITEKKYNLILKTLKESYDY